MPRQFKFIQIAPVVVARAVYNPDGGAETAASIDLFALDAQGQVWVSGMSNIDGERTADSWRLYDDLMMEP